MKEILTAKSILHVDETNAQIIKQSDGKSGQSNAYNWVFRSVPSQGPIIVLFQSALSRGRAVLEDFTAGFRGTVICDGYSAYGNLPSIKFANCWAHYPRRSIIREELLCALKIQQFFFFFSYNHL